MRAPTTESPTRTSRCDSLTDTASRSCSIRHGARVRRQTVRPRRTRSKRMRESANERQERRRPDHPTPSEDNVVPATAPEPRQHSRDRTPRYRRSCSCSYSSLSTSSDLLRHHSSPVVREFLNSAAPWARSKKRNPRPLDACFPSPRPCGGCMYVYVYSEVHVERYVLVRV